ncbi:MAG: hypothetical protein AUI50_00325 [Crenarchaeota archaeon 13_1_40CM_2_52_14]|nr:MAG: hypothetical protein AUI50_00325 [Crenarchaeota archaeon 13_1_40CM_2_52_14]OLE69959.1 MAG: hypothetical protein AUF78_08760 [archaeon 13_1_20CM_2_51_12]
MVVPEHAQVPHTNRCHQGAYHLIELARSGPKNSAKSGVPHVKEGFYPRIIRRVAFTFLSRFAVRPFIFGH